MKPKGGFTEAPCFRILTHFLKTMASVLRYGADASVTLEFSDGSLVGECGVPSAPPLESPADATAWALADPLDFPALPRSTTPGDRVSIALDQGVPRGAEIVAGVVRSLEAAGVGLDGVTVVRTRADAEAGIGDPTPWLANEEQKRITLAIHDPDDRRALAYLAASQSGEPVLLSRAIVDADVVLPVGCLRTRATAGYTGIHNPILPTFADRRILSKFRSPSALDRQGRTKQAPSKLANEVAWLLGVMLTIQAVPGPGGDLLHVLAGKPEAVRLQGRRLYRAAWRSTVPRRADLVVAAIQGGPQQQTWQNLGNALAAAGRLVRDGGAIAVCSELRGEPGPGFQQLSSARSRKSALREIRRTRPEDALPAVQLNRVQGRAKVFLLSRLDETLVEDLRIAHVARPDELARLARRADSCIVLANAPYAMVRAEED